MIIESEEFRALLEGCRSYRRFDAAREVGEEEVEFLASLARLTPSAANLQPLKLVGVTDPKVRAEIFPALKWAGYLTGWDGPAEKERPAAYLILLSNADIPAPSFDAGIVSEAILLGARTLGLGGCILGAIDRTRLASVLNLAEGTRIEVVIALGKPAETVVIDPVRDGNIRYTRDERQVHHVPKREMREYFSFFPEKTT